MRLFLLALAAFQAVRAQTPLPQSVTNGNSKLGTINNPPLNACVGQAGSDSSCWSTLGSSFPAMPNGVDRVYTFDITRGVVAPDGVRSSTLLVNGAFPGPTIEANYGDWFVVTVRNRIANPVSGTTIHWHGMKQKDTKFMDGVPSVAQCPIAPGESFTYRFRADRIGTSWWHAHFGGQTAGGLSGAMVIHGPSQLRYDYDLGAIHLADRYHLDYREVVQALMTGVLLPSNNNLINGKMRFDCRNTTLPCTPGADISRFRFRSGKYHVLRLINSGSEALQHFRIDGHKLIVAILDFTPVVPYETNVVTLSPGQRATIVVKGVGTPSSSYWMRSTIDTVCGLAAQPNALAGVYYESADATKDPTTKAEPYTTNGCLAAPLKGSVPLIPETPPAASFRQNYDFVFAPNDTGTAVFTTNGRQFRANLNNALLAQATSPSFRFSSVDPKANLYDFGTNSSVRVVMKSFFFAPHPMHLHGHDFYVLAEGFGDWNGVITNPNNPLRRDTHQLQGSRPDGTPAYAVIQFNLDNPGIWGLHCHIFAHLTLGMYINVAYGKKAIEGLSVPAAVTDSCRKWNAYASTTTVDQPDSGL